MKKKVLALMLVLALVLGLAACGGSSSGSTASDSQTSESTASESQKEETPAPTEAPAESSEEESTPAEPEEKILYANGAPQEFFEEPWKNANEPIDNKILYETIIGMDEDLAPTTDCGMAESYEVSEDGMEMTVTLRDGLMWHDGVEVTGEDIVFSIETMIQDAVTAQTIIKSTMKCLKGATEYLEGSADTIEGIAVDGNKITFTFESVPANLLLAMGETAILPKHLLENCDVTQFQQDPYFQAPVGSGPFKLGEVKIGEYTEFLPNENYWGGVADYKIIASASSPESDPNLVANAKAGYIDYAFTKNYADVQALTGEAGITITPVTVNYTRWLMINEFQHDGKENKLADKRVRQAIAYAIDKATICETVFEGAADPGDGTWTPTGSVWKNTDVEAYDYNPDKARELLAEAGWDSSQVLKCVYYYQDQATADLMAIIQQYLADVGIQFEASLVTGDLASQINVAPTSHDADGQSNMDWDLLYGALSAMSPLEYYGRLATTNSANYCVITNEEVDELVATLFGTTDQEVQMDAYKKIEAIQAEEMYYVPLYYQPCWVVTSDKVTGIVEKWGNPQFAWDMQMQNWQLNY